MTRFGLFLVWALCASAAVAAKAPKAAGLPSAWLLKIEHEPVEPHSGQEVKITARVGTNVTAVQLEYQVIEPGAYVELKDAAYKKNWVALPMEPGVASTKGVVLQARLPGQLQKHRWLVRYRVAAVDSEGHRVQAPGRDEAPPNYAYFVYDGIPAWTGALNPQSRDPKLTERVTFSTEAMSRVQAYHLLAKRTSVEKATWKEPSGGKEHKYTGTLVVGPRVFDHVGFRARGGGWRYAMGKNMWKFDFSSEEKLHARDDFGQAYPAAWGKLNLGACIQQGDYGQRGEQGLFESVGFRLFNLAGVPAPFTHWVQLRIIDQADESPASQYRGDFWGLYLAVENEDGNFLKAHQLPSGNLYKIQYGQGELQHRGKGAVTNGSDLAAFTADCGRSQSAAWWRTNFDLPSYYSYRAICECIHHYDTGEGKNYDYYHHPVTGRWQILPWDIDLTWADNMYGNGEDPFKYPILSQSEFQLEFQNRLREIRDLLFNPEEAGRLIDEFASVIWDSSGKPSIVEADRRQWDYHPVMAMGGKAGQGLYYQASPTRDFPGMVRRMRDYVRSRGAWIDSQLLNDPGIPATPAAVYLGPTNFPARQLRFRASPYKGTAAFSALKWRLAEIPSKKATTSVAASHRLYEIRALWESPESTQADTSIEIPPDVAQPGHAYRVRVRIKDATGRWSHWSGPVTFVVGKGSE